MKKIKVAIMKDCNFSFTKTMAIAIIKVTGNIGLKPMLALDD